MVGLDRRPGPLRPPGGASIRSDHIDGDDPLPAKPLGEVGLGGVHHLGPAVGDEKGDAFVREAGIERQVGAAGAQDPERTGHRLRRSLGKETDQLWPGIDAGGDLAGDRVGQRR
jgi:hypothetical protein